jgi:hypothetical protein
MAEPLRHKCARCCMGFRVEALPPNAYAAEFTSCKDCRLLFNYAHAFINEALVIVCRVRPDDYAHWMGIDSSPACQRVETTEDACQRLAESNEGVSGSLHREQHDGAVDGQEAGEV